MRNNEYEKVFLLALLLKREGELPTAGTAGAGTVMRRSVISGRSISGTGTGFCTVSHLGG